MSGVAVLIALRVLNTHQVRVGLLAKITCERQDMVTGVVHRLHHLQRKKGFLTNNRPFNQTCYLEINQLKQS